MTQVLRFSQLSPQRQRLVRLSQALNFGQIHGVRLQDGDPILEHCCPKQDRVVMSVIETERFGN